MRPAPLTLRLLPLLGLAAACAGGDPSAKDSGGADDTAADTGSAPVDPLAWPLDADGPYTVGHATIEVRYTTPLGADRTIPVQVFYPTTATTGAEVRYDALFLDPRALGGAAAAPPVEASGYPLLVHSHGHFGVAGAVDFWAARLVSQGWVVAAVEHVGNRFQDGFPSFDLPSPTAHYIERPADMSASLDALLAGAAPLAGAIDPARVATSGHSRGAYTVWATAGATFDPAAIAAGCAGETDAFESRSCTPEEEAVFVGGGLADPRFRASILLDGSIRRELVGAEGHRAATTPFLALTQANSGAQEQFDSVDPLDFSWVPVEGSCHETFNLGVEAATLQPCATMEVERGWQITATYSFAFLRHHLMGDTSTATMGVLSGDVVVDEAAVLQHKGP